MAGRKQLRPEVEEEIRGRLRRGESSCVIGAAVGCSSKTVQRRRAELGGVPSRRVVSDRFLSLRDREEISRGLAAGWSFSEIARGLGRSTSTISREVNANGGRQRYRGWPAQRRAEDRRCRPKPAKLAVNLELRERVQGWLELGWSPQQIARRLRVEFADRPEMHVSHETIYQSLYVQGKGALRKELTACLRTGRALRRPRGRAARAVVSDRIMISERPAEVEDRAVPGHWEGDLLAGAYNQSAIGTLVERNTRFVMLLHLPDNHGAEAVRQAMAAKIVTLPEQLRRSVTWDQGVEMAQHAQFTVETGVPVYFCDPHSPWQRGTNENTNGLLRQYFPKGTNLSVHSAEHLDAIAALLNGRPRQTLDWMTPSERFAQLVATTP